MRAAYMAAGQGTRAHVARAAARATCLVAGQRSEVPFARATAASSGANPASLAAAAIAANRAASLSTRACEVDQERVRKFEQAIEITMGYRTVLSGISGARVKDIAAITALKPGAAPQVKSIECYLNGEENVLTSLLLAASNVEKLEVFMDSDDVRNPFKNLPEGALDKLTEVTLNGYGWTKSDLVKLANIAPNLEGLTLGANTARSIKESKIQEVDMTALANIDIQAFDDGKLKSGSKMIFSLMISELVIDGDGRFDGCFDGGDDDGDDGDDGGFDGGDGGGD